MSEHDLALLRVYGVAGLKPLGLASDQSPKGNVELTGISDPQNQGGGHAASTVRATVSLAGSNGDLALAPVPALGFSGAAARDDAGKFAGLALLRPVTAAGPATAPQAVLVSADTVRDFLKVNGVTEAQGSNQGANQASNDAAAAVVRVICVRK